MRNDKVINKIIQKMEYLKSKHKDKSQLNTYFSSNHQSSGITRNLNTSQMSYKNHTEQAQKDSSFTIIRPTHLNKTDMYDEVR